MAGGSKRGVGSSDPNGKAAMERVGLFSEVGYISIGDRYNNAHPNSKPFNMTAYKGKQMMVSGNNKHSACQSGYFEPKFSRILEAEAYVEATQVKRKNRLERTKKNDWQKSLVSIRWTQRTEWIGKSLWNSVWSNWSFFGRIKTKTTKNS